MHTSVEPLVRAGFSVHPSHVGILADFGEAEGPIYLDINANGAAQYLGPTPDTSENLRPGGLADASIELVSKNKIEIYFWGFFLFINLSCVMLKLKKNNDAPKLLVFYV